jgi:hypothetical protein
MKKVAVVIYSDLEGAGHSAVYRAMMFVDELLRAGDDVALVFDGAGTKALAAIMSPENDVHRAWLKAEKALRGACSYCAKAYGVLDALKARDIPLLTDDKGHASLRALLYEDRQIVTF